MYHRANDFCSQNETTLDSYKYSSQPWAYECNTNIAKIFGNPQIRDRINYIALGKIYGSFYEENIIQEIDQNNVEFCCSMPSDGLSAKVWCIQKLHLYFS